MCIRDSRYIGMYLLIQDAFSFPSGAILILIFIFGTDGEAQPLTSPATKKLKDAVKAAKI